MCLGFLKYFSIYKSSLPKYFFASFFAKENNSEDLGKNIEETLLKKIKKN